tara:strand:+ start:755 stop:1645 length:891 start_codon:yes stop_codon:yes gene_type:complete
MSFKIASEVGLLGENHFANVPFKGPNQGFTPSREAQEGSKIEFIPIHYKNAPVISFIAYMKNIKDTIDQKVNEQAVFGRPDPIRIWKSSGRKITLGLDIPSSSEEMALRNLNNLNWLLASGYPTYGSTEGCSSCSSAVAASPLFRVKYANIISNTSPTFNGLLSVIQSFGVTHDFSKGAIYVDAGGSDAAFLRNAGFAVKAKKIIVAAVITLDITLDIVHEHSMGWDAQTGEWRGDPKGASFPYGIGLQKHTSDPPASKGAGATHAGAVKADTFLSDVASPAMRESRAAAEKVMGK